MVLAKAFIYKPGKVSPVELLGISLVLVKVHLFSTQVLADWPPKKKPSYPGWKAMKVECCGCWVHEKTSHFWNMKKYQNPVWEHHDSSNFYRIFFAWWIKWYLFGWIEVQQRWTSAKVSVACRAHFQYRLRSYHVCTQLSGFNCSAATDLKCCQKNTPKLHNMVNISKETPETPFNVNFSSHF